MKYCAFLILLMLAAVGRAVDQERFPTFQVYVKRYHKEYTAEEYMQRKLNYQQKIAVLKASGCTTCGVTKFTDRSPTEIKNKLDLLVPAGIKESPPAAYSKLNSQFRRISAPRGIDWRERGAVTSVKDQGECGCCWSFATVAMVESSLILKDVASNNFLSTIDLSEQFLLKCTRGSDCNGGYLETAVDKAISAGLPEEKYYKYNPYNNDAGICTATNKVQVSKQPRKTYYGANDLHMMELLTSGPVAIAVSGTGWEDYASGTFRCEVNAEVNHAVLLIGYTSDAWIMKNQWGTDWGVDGYIYVTRDADHNCKVGSAVHALYAHRSLMGLASILFVILCS